MTSLPIFLRPRVDVEEIDLTQRVSVILSSTAAVTAEFERGPLKPTYFNGLIENFYKKYGQIANPQKYGFGYDTVTTYSKESVNTLVTRVAGAGAKHAGSHLIKDNTRLLSLPFTSGSAGGYESLDADNIVLLKFAGPLIADNTFKLDITNGVTIVTTTLVTFATNHNATMVNIASAIQAALNTSFGTTSASATVYTETSSTALDSNRIIVIRVPASLSLSFLSPVVAAGTAQTTASLVTNSKLGDIYSENPGDWGNSYGYKLTGFDTGIRQRFLITLSQALVTDNVISLKINGETVSVTYTTSSDATLQAFASLIAANSAITSAVVKQVAGAVNNDRQIEIVAAVSGNEALTLSEGVVSSGASQAIVVIAETLKGVSPDHSFNIEIYEKSNLNKYVERFKVSFQSVSDARGVPLNVEQVINRSSNRSLVVRFVQSVDTKAENYSLFNNVGVLPSVPANVSYFAGGDDGVAPTSADIKNGWSLITDRTIYPVNMLLNAGYSNTSVMQHMVGLARERFDCMAILDCPYDKLLAEDYRKFRLEELNIDDSYGAIYGPYVEIEDSRTGQRRFIPPSGPVGATWANNDRISNQMGSPFGLNRGKVRYITGLSHYYNNGEQELLHPNQCNFIIDRPGVGPVIWSERTLQYKPSVLQAVHARRILNIAKTGLVDNLEYIIGDNNNKGTRYRARNLGDTLLGPIKRGGGLYYYGIRCDEINNTAEVIDAEILAFDVYLQISRIIRGVALRTILLRTGVIMEEVEGLEPF
jgi:hypothetical protein